MELPLFTATAWYHHRLPADLQAFSQAEAVARATVWARGTLAPALDREASLTAAERAPLVAGVVRFTGLPADAVGAGTLLPAKEVMTDRLLAAEGRELGRYDARLSLPARNAGQQWGPREDPSLRPMVDLMEGTSAPAIRYLRDTLGYRSDLLYRGPWGGAFHPEPMVPNPAGVADDWMAMLWDHGAAMKPPLPGPPPEIARFGGALAVEPTMRVWNVGGLYDVSCAERDEALARADTALRARVRNSCYAAGHMVYTDAAVRTAMQRDFAAFVDGR